MPLTERYYKSNISTPGLQHFPVAVLGVALNMVLSFSVIEAGVYPVETRLPRVGCLLSCLLFLLAAVPAFSQQVSPQPLITQPIDESQLTTLKGNTHPLAQPQFDIGVAAPDMPLQRMLLVLKRSPQQDFALSKLLDNQQDKGSPNYHKWLTPDEFGAHFGPSDQDVQLITGWLQSHGLQVNRVAHGRSVIEFSGVESQVEGAFHTQIHAYMVNGQQHWANASDPQIPAALAPAVAGVLSLNNFPSQPMLHVAGTMSRDKSTGQVTPVKPDTTLLGNCGVQNHCYGVGPYDFATIYNVAPLWNATPAIDGTGQTIAIVGETDINPQDIADFRNYFGLPPVTLNVIHDGPAPGILTNGEETESDLDVEWSSAVAKGATIDFVVSQSTETTAGIDLSDLYIIDNNLAPVMSESYGFCELGLGTAGNQGFNALWEQAAAQGITVMISAGDNGAAGCDNFDALGPAQFGLQVSGYASTPFNVAVGGTDFYDLTNASLYWNPTNASTTQASAIKYIPETTWDDSCTNPVFGTLLGFSNNAETNCNNQQLIQNGFINVVGGSGGKSNCTVSDGQHPATCSVGYPKPSWQVAPGVPADGVRDIPDVSLMAASGSPSGSFYIVCEADRVGGSSCDPTNPNTQFLGVGGTSASAPAFAGVMALVNQQVPTAHGQGNANYVLYKLAAAQNAASCNSTNGSGASCVFNDVTTGTNAMPCAAGSPNCTVQTPGDQYGILSGFNTGTGYDLATGLGSVNVNNLVTNWNTAVFRSSATTLTLGPPTSGITHGQAVNVNISVTPGSGSGTPSGDASLLTSTGVGVEGFTLSNGTVSGTTTLLPGGTYTVTAHYAGDSVFGGSDSAPVNVTVGKENSSPRIAMVTFDVNGNLISSNATTAVYGSLYLLRVDVFGNSGTPCLPNPLGGAACPTGSVTLTDNGGPLDAGTYPLNSWGFTEDQTVQLPGGNNSVKAQYAGDNSFNASSTTNALTITPASTGTNVCCPYTNFTVGQNAGATANVFSFSSGVAPTGTVTFLDNGKVLPGTPTYSNPGGAQLNATLVFPFSTSGPHNISAAYNGDSNYSSSVSTPMSDYAYYPTTTGLNISTTTPPANGTVTLTALVDTPANLPITGSVIFSYTPRFAGTPAPIPGTPTLTQTTDAQGNSALQAVLTFVPSSNLEDVFATFIGDSNYSLSTSNRFTIAVAGNDFTLDMTTAPLIMPAGSQGVTGFEIDAQSGYNGTATFTAGALPAETTVTFTPTSITGSGQISVQISTMAPHAAASGKAGQGVAATVLFATVLPFVGLVVLGGRRQRIRPVLVLVLCCSIFAASSCGGGSGGGGGSGFTDPGTPKGSYQINVTVTSNTGIVHTGTLPLVIQ
jgi:subtilase family serine protease